MLSANGESPTSSLTDPLAAHVDMAFQILKVASRTVQSRGWQFNTVRAVTLTPISHADMSNPDKVAVPTGALRIRKTVTDAQRDYDISHREGYLWNNRTNTAAFIAASFPNGVQVDIVYAVDFISLPETARSFIFISAARSYAEKTVSNPDVSGFLRQDEAQALANLVDAEGLAEPVSIIEGHKDQRQVNAQFDKVSRQVQSIGWHFNSRFNVALTPAVGICTLPANTLTAVKSDRYDQSTLNITQRGTKMYDLDNGTFTFDTSDLPNGLLYVDVITYLSDPADLPECARRYIEIKTARQMQPQKQVGAPTGFTERDEYLAFRDLQDTEGLIQDNNLLTNIDTYRIMYGRQSVYGTTSNLINIT